MIVFKEINTFNMHEMRFCININNTGFSVKYALQKVNF